jgi:hypothetical protein
MTRPSGTVGTSTPEKIWIANPKAATSRAATVTLPLEDRKLRWFIRVLLAQWFSIVRRSVRDLRLPSPGIKGSTCHQ